jgi:hypothetical protein
MLRRTRFIVPTFSKSTPNKIANSINVSGKNTLINTDCGWRLAIADEPFDAKVDGKKMFCVRVDDAGSDSDMMIGFTPMETFDSTKVGYFGYNGFTGCGIYLRSGSLFYPVQKSHNIIGKEICKYTNEIIVILTISNNGTKKEIRFLCDGKESESFDASEHLNGDLLFPAICFYGWNQQITTIPIDQSETRTPETEELIEEYREQQQQQQQQQNKNHIPFLPSVSSEINDQVISQLRQQINDDHRILIQEKDKQIQEMRKSYEEQLKHARMQNEEMRKDFLKQLSDSQKNLLQHFESERQILRTQLDLERAEHQKTRNLLSLKK